MSKRRTRKTRFVTGFTIVMIIFSILFAFPSIIEGINIGRNMQEYHESNEFITPESYKVLKFEIKSNNRIQISVRGLNSTATNITEGEYSYLRYNDVPVICAIMSEDEFLPWYDLGGNKPNIINTTYFYEGEYTNVENLGIKSDGYYYFIFYNANSYEIDAFIDLEIMPWGHIIATSIVGFGFAICFLGLLTKIGFTGFFALSQISKPKVLTLQSQGTTEAVLQPEKDENFCISCGASITKKDGRYCPNCGSST